MQFYKSILLTICLASNINAFCISDAEAITVGNNFAHLVSNYSDAFANKTLAPTFSDQTDSVITLIDSASQPQVPIMVGPHMPFQPSHTDVNCRSWAA